MKIKCTPSKTGVYKNLYQYVYVFVRVGTCCMDSVTCKDDLHLPAKYAGNICIAKNLNCVGKIPNKYTFNSFFPSTKSFYHIIYKFWTHELKKKTMLKLKRLSTALIAFTPIIETILTWHLNFWPSCGLE